MVGVHKKEQGTNGAGRQGRAMGGEMGQKTLFPEGTYLTGSNELLQPFERTMLQEQQSTGKAKVVRTVGQTTLLFNM